MSHIKLIAIDMDGTLVNSQRIITPEVKNTIIKASQSGIYVVLCTGRPILGVMSALAELSLLQNENYVISYNGALLQRADTQKIIYRSTLNHDDFIRLEALGKRLALHSHALDMENVYTTYQDISKYTVIESYLCHVALRYREVSEFSNDLTLLKMVFVEEPPILEAGIRRIPAEYFERYTIIKSEKHYLEILNKESSKGHTLERLAMHLGLAPNQVMAIGDNENDISMLEYAGTSVAMGNALPQVKAISDFQTKSNNEHGVAYAIEQWALK